jgi:hypothetical protein
MKRRNKSAELEAAPRPGDDAPVLAVPARTAKDSRRGLNNTSADTPNASANRCS